MSTRTRRVKRQRDCIYDHNDLPHFLNGVCECEEMEVQMKNASTQTITTHFTDDWFLNIPRSVNRFIARDMEIHKLQKRANELRKYHENEYTSDESSVEQPKNDRHVWWMFLVNHHGKKEDIDCFLHHFSNKWIYQCESEQQSNVDNILPISNPISDIKGSYLSGSGQDCNEVGQQSDINEVMRQNNPKKYVIGVFQLDSTRYKNKIRLNDVLSYDPATIAWCHHIHNKKAAILFCQKTHNRTSGPYSNNIPINTLF